MTTTDPTQTSGTSDEFPFRLMDADEHSTPRFGVYAQYIDPDKRDLAITVTPGEGGYPNFFYAGKPARLRPKNYQVTFSDDQLADLGVAGAGSTEGVLGDVVPGSLLNKLNPLKGLDADGRKEFARRYRELQPLLDNPEDRLSVMDSQGIEAAINYAAIATEYEFEDNWEALYANQRAENRYLATEWGFAYKNRLFTPPVISTVDAEAAVAELDAVMSDPHGAPKVIQLVAGPSIHRSPFRDELDPFWARLNEAHVKVCTHLSSVTFYGRQGLEWDEEEVMLGDMDALQWTLYYGDRPAYETVAAAVLQGIFARFPNIQLLLSEQGTLWLPYIARKMDHAFLMGRRATWGTLEMRPSEYLTRHVKVAPFPEENVMRAIDAVGLEPIVFGSDFPHGEGLPDPSVYRAQLKDCNEEQVHAIMRGNLADFLDLPV
jgi:predicted TIM-barrel fold metal-dependent hydrolase